MSYRPSDWSALGYGSDPVPGDPEIVRAGGQHYVQTADSMHNAAATLRALNAGASSGSKSVEALKKDCAQVLSDVEKAENRYREAGNALIDYAYALDAAQAITLQALIAAQNALEAATAARRSAATYDRMALDAHGLQDTEEQTRCTRLAASHRSDAAEYDAQVATQRQIAAQAVADRDAAANRAMERIQQATSQDGLKDSWWDDWGAKVVSIIATIAEWVSTIAGILALLVCWIPIIGQALAGVLLAIAAVAAIVAALANIVLAATGEKSWTEAIISIVGAVLACVGLGALKGVFGGLKGLFAGLKAAGKSFKAVGGIKAFGGVGGLAKTTLNNFAASVKNVAGSVKNAFNARFRPDVKPPTRPSWRQSEIDAAQAHPDYSTQTSFKGQQPTPPGTSYPKGSTRPDLYSETGYPNALEVKNYLIPTNQASLIRTLTGQLTYRGGQLPPGATQGVILDIRTQFVSLAVRNSLYKDILGALPGVVKTISFMA